MKRPVVEHEGMGYALRMPDVATELVVGRLVTSRGEISGELTVSCALPSIASQDGHVFRGRFNLSSPTARGTMAKHLASRTAGADLDWPVILETLCVGVLSAESEGTPFEDVGARPQRIDPGFLVEPLLPFGKPTILFGDGGVGKSFFAVAMAVSIASGEVVIEGFRPRPAMPVTYLDWETDRDDIDARVKAVTAGAGIGRVTIRYRSCARPLADMTEDVARQMADAPGLVVIDSVGLAAGTSSDGADAADSALRFFSALRAIGATSLSIDHVAKATAGQQGGAGKPYGSTYKTNLARSTWELRQARTPDTDGTVHLGLFHRKANTSARHRPIGLAMKFTGGAVTWTREEVRDEGLAEPTSNADAIAAALSPHPLRVGEIAKKTGLADNLIRAELSRHKSRFVKVATGDWGLLEAAREEPA